MSDKKRRRKRVRKPPHISTKLDFPTFFLDKEFHHRLSFIDQRRILSLERYYYTENIDPNGSRMQRLSCLQEEMLIDIMIKSRWRPRFENRAPDLVPLNLLENL